MMTFGLEGHLSFRKCIKGCREENYLPNRQMY